ncbi:MAG: eukaryotic-like serine/threonine-protein kinase [Myxococcales bacterium]|nr:eukaryotic-like serine/threonine-protein kinase [Myxococcales bacterium]
MEATGRLSRLAPGQRFGAYLVEDRVGEGGMGAVYRAVDTKLGRTVALKVIRTEGADGATADVIARFLRESRVGASLAHPNIVVVFEAGAIGDCPYLAMEWIDGMALADWMDRGPAVFGQAQRLDVLEAVADALAHAHSKGVIHRDVKPTNVMLDQRGRTRLVDFGIAKPTSALGPGTQMLPTHARALLGTPAYMAPEQMLSPSVDARADQFSWGVMAYELLCDAHPNETVPPDGPPFPVAKARPLGWSRPDIPDALAAVVHRAMSYEPGARFGSMEEVLYGMRAARSTAAQGPSAHASTPPPYVGGPGAHPYAGQASPYDATAQAYRQAGSTVARANETQAPAPAPLMSSAPMQAMSNAPGAMQALSNAPGAIPAPRRFPWVVVAGVLASLLVVSGGGIALLLLSVQGGGAALPSLPSLPGPAGALGPKSAFIEALDLKFANASAAEVAKSKAAVETKLTSCFDAHVSKELSFSTRIFVVADGRITKADDLQVCKEQHPGFYLCTERVNAAKPKSGFPTVPESVFACVDRAFTSSRLPRVIVDPGEATTHADLHVQVR